MTTESTNFTRYPVSEVTKIKDMATCWIDRYWVVTENQEILIFKNCSPQCNPIKEIVERMASLHKDCHVEFIPVVYLRHDVSGYIY